MLNKTLPILLLFTIAITLLSCSSIKNIEYRNLEIVKIEKINLTDTQLQVSLFCYNPNNFGINILKSKLDIYLNESKIGTSDQTQSIRILKKSEFKSSLSVSINLKKTILNLGLGFLNQEFDLKVKGIVRIKKGPLVKDLPVDFSKKLKIDLL